jgi:hypothetical protein
MHITLRFFSTFFKEHTLNGNNNMFCTRELIILLSFYISTVNKLQINWHVLPNLSSGLFSFKTVLDVKCLTLSNNDIEIGFRG